jgi:hypothetical protein
MHWRVKYAAANNLVRPSHMRSLHYARAQRLEHRPDPDFCDSFSLVLWSPPSLQGYWIVVLMDTPAQLCYSAQLLFLHPMPVWHASVCRARIGQPHAPRSIESKYMRQPVLRLQGHSCFMDSSVALGY